MQIPKRVIQLAKERALFGFSMLSQRMISDADNGIMQAIPVVRTPFDQRTMYSARQFLRQDGPQFLKRLDAFFRDYLERAMQTMYTDLRVGLHNMSADRLSLIDDETMTRQIEVDRLVVRMRDADHEGLGRLNMIIAQLHGDHEVRERENPFRPYLLARSLYEVLGGMVKEEAVVKVLFEYLSNSMIHQLPPYHMGIREIFESNGIRSRLLARPSILTPAQREMLARQSARSGFGLHPNNPDNGIGSPPLPPTFNSRILPGLQRMLDARHEPGHATSAGNAILASAQESKTVGFQDFVWQIFNQQKPMGLPRPKGRTVQSGQPGNDADGKKSFALPVSPLVAKLKQYQQLAARGQAIDGQPAFDQNQLIGIKDKIGADKITETERVTVDVIALLFEFILQDEQIPGDMRTQIGRLQIPFLKASVLTSELLHHSGHPARRFLNRIGGLAAGLNHDDPMDQQISAEITRVIGSILEKFDDDMVIFSSCQDALEHFLAQLLRNTDAETARRVDAIEETERISVVLSSATSTLRNLLPPLNIDQRITDFIMHIWVRVVAYLLGCEAAANSSPDSVAAINQYRGVLPELVWSIQAKHNSQERNALIKLLPDLVKRLRKGLEMIRLPEQELKQVMDLLVNVHTEVLRGSQPGNTGVFLSLEELYQHFSLLSVCEGSFLWTEDAPLIIPPAVIENALAVRSVTADLNVDRDAIPALESDTEWLQQMCLGICVEISTSDNRHELARLTWVSSQHSIYMFTLYGSADPVICSSISLLKALRDGVIHPIEYAPLFDRAVESLLVGTESLGATRASA